jgi:hypothetical protein
VSLVDPLLLAREPLQAIPYAALLCQIADVQLVSLAEKDNGPQMNTDKEPSNLLRGGEYKHQWLEC